MNGTTPLRHNSSGGSVTEPVPVATLVVYKDDRGYGMKVSGDKPVYVQSVKEGGAAARAGLQSGDKIIKVNGVNVMQSTHTEVVELIKSATQVVLTVQQGSVKMATGYSSSQHHRPTSLPTGSVHVSNVQGGSSHHRSSTTPAGTERITGPQPVDHEKKRQMETQRIVTLQLMLENEQSFVDRLRSELARAAAGATNFNNATSLQAELSTAERRLKKVQEQLEQLSPSATNISNALASGGGGGGGDTPPPLPSRKSLTLRYLSPPPLPPRPLPNSQNVVQSEQERQLTSSVTGGIPNSFSQGPVLGSKHQRAKSSPDQLGAISPAEASRRLIASESSETSSPVSRSGARLSGIDLDDPPGHRTPPGTPPPPYPAPVLGDVSATNESGLDNFNALSSPRSQSVLDGSNSGLPMIQQPIMSMEDDDMSDQEVGQLEDHGPFKVLSKLWQHHGHLAVFINYVFSNSDPSSLLFYLITDLYKEGNAKEMKKWAYEIHSTFLVPGAPLRLNNVDEKIAREIDDDLHKESDKEEKLRMIFHKARKRAKEELNEQLADFQQKRIAGLGTLFGPSDAQLDESTCDKSRETKIVETYLLPKMETYLEDIEKENVDQRKFATAASLATVLTKVFQVRQISLDRVPTFVAKDKSQFKARLSAAKARKMTVRGHHFVAHQYFNVIYCNHCQFIIGGIGPQGYQCGNCSLNVHRQCVKIVEENCPGPLVKKEKGNDRISKLMERIRPEKKPPSHHNQNQMHHNERMKRAEEESSPSNDHENGDHRGSCPAGSARGGSERGRVSGFGSCDHADSMDDPSSREDVSEMVQNISSKPKTSNINRSESYKERINNRKQLREKRKTSDPNLSKTNDCDGSAGGGGGGGAFPGNSAGSSSNSSLSTRSLDSPSTSLEQVHPNHAAAAAAAAAHHASSASWDSDVDVEPDTPDWSQGVAEDVLASLTSSEKKRQEVINELFHTERSHVRALKVLSQVFHRPMLETQILPADQIQLLFSNLDEMVTLHSKFNQAMKLKKKENPYVGDVGDLLLDMFDGEAGEVFERAASKYCAKQQIALNALRDQRRKDPKLNSFLNEVEANPMCRRLQLKDHIVTGMIRLTKYPLLFENLGKCTPEQNEKERAAVLRALERSKKILSHVNQAVREAQDYDRLVEIQRIVDRGYADLEKTEIVKNLIDPDKIQEIFNEIKNLDVTKRLLIHEGSLQWRLPKGKPVDLHVVLLNDTVLLLHRQDDKLALKMLNQNHNSVLSPLVKVSTVLVRHNAVDKFSLYLVNTSHNGAQIYDLVAPSSEERKLWFKHIHEVTEVYKADREGRRPMPQSSSSDDLIESPEDQLLPETPQQNAGTANATVPPPATATASGTSTTNVQDSTNVRTNDKTEQDKRNETTPAVEATLSSQQQQQKQSTETIDAASPAANSSEAEASDKDEGAATAAPERTDADPTAEDKKKVETEVAASVTEPLRLVTCTQNSLVDPVEVHVEERPVHVAEPVLTPIECIRRKDDLLKQTLSEKQSLVYDILNIPKKQDEEVADGTAISEIHPKELIQSALGKMNHLHGLVNSALSVSETDTVLATQSATATGGCEATGCPAPRVHARNLEPSIPVSEVQRVLNSLTPDLTQLLECFMKNHEDNERLRKELQRERERRHAIDAEAQRRETTETPPSTLPEMSTQNQHETSDDPEPSNDEHSKEITPDVQNDVETSTTEDHVDEIRPESENEVMGDSAG